MMLIRRKKEGKIQKSGFCLQAQMKEDITEVLDLQSVNRHQMMCNSWFAVKTKGTTDDEGQIEEVRECGENENIKERRTSEVWAVRNMEVTFFHKQQF